MLNLFKRKKEIEYLKLLNDGYLAKIKSLESTKEALLHRIEVLNKKVEEEKEKTFEQMKINEKLNEEVDKQRDKVKDVLKVKKDENLEKKKKWLGGFYGEEYGKQ